MDTSGLSGLSGGQAADTIEEVGGVVDQTDQQGLLMAVAVPPGISPFGMLKLSKHYVVTRPMEPKKKSKDRKWKNRPKVSSNLSKDFPWEVVLRFLHGHARSLILLQMVDKNLNHLISTDHKLWVSIFKREIKFQAYCIRTVQDPMYPNLRLWKPHLTGLPVYNGPLRGDPDDSSLGFAFDTSFFSYVRRVYALLHGTRCGLCGCRHRHEAYWSLRMRVCRLCMEANTISGEALSRKYGVDYSDMLVKHKGQFFFYTCNINNNDDRISVHHVTRADVHARNTTYMFWLPHLRKFLDLPSLYKQQNERRNAGSVLSRAVRRRWLTLQRNIFGTKKAHYSIDCLLAVIYRNEKKRFTHPYGVAVAPGGPAWAFSDIPRSGKPKLTLRNGENITLFYRLVSEYEDWVV